MCPFIYIPALLSIAVLAWTSSLYYLFLDRKPTDHSSPGPEAGDGDPLRFALVIPCYREERLIGEKLADTATLDYPPERFEVFVVDGGSDDRTGEIAGEFCSPRENFHFLVSDERGKIPQVNLALGKIDGGIVVITDVDGRLEPDTLKKWEAIYRDPAVGCVGAFVTPADPLPEDRIFWQHQNAMRTLESRLGHSSVLVAVAYSFRRELFERFPDDVIADDVYTAFVANTGGRKSLYGAGSRAVELRGGNDRRGMLLHKLRKLNANMRELKRFLPALGEMRPPWRMMFITKVLQSWLAAPCLLGLAGLVIISLPGGGTATPIFWGGALIFLAVLHSLAERVLKRSNPGEESGGSHRFSYGLLFLAILIGGFFRYFFVRQSSSYRRVD